MSASAELQTIIFNRLTQDPRTAAIVAGRIYDNAPPDAVFPYVSFGPSDVVEDDADCIKGRIETIQIDCWARSNARIRPVKELCDAVRAALHLYSADPGFSALVEMRVTLSRCFMDPDGLTGHGVVQVSCILEESNG